MLHLAAFQSNGNQREENETEKCNAVMMGHEIRMEVGCRAIRHRCCLVDEVSEAAKTLWWTTGTIVLDVGVAFDRLSPVLRQAYADEL